MSVGRYKSLHSLAESVIGAIDKGEINHALRLIHDFVELIITEPLCTSQVFGSEIMNDLYQCIGKANLTDSKYPPAKPEESGGRSL